MANESSGGLAERARRRIRQLIEEGVLTAGSPIRQELLAESLGMSRVPVREALKTLEADGVVRYELNIGFTVSTLSLDVLSQVYLMRQALERELLSSAARQEDMNRPSVKHLETLNRQMKGAAELGDFQELVRLNREFHFGMFRNSRLPFIVEEVGKLWNIVAAYQALYIYNSGSRTRVIDEHAEMIQALRDGDGVRLIKLMDLHRDHSQDEVRGLLSPPAKSFDQGTHDMTDPANTQEDSD